MEAKVFVREAGKRSFSRTIEAEAQLRDGKRIADGEMPEILCLSTVRAGTIRHRRQIVYTGKQSYMRTEKAAISMLSILCTIIMAVRTAPSGYGIPTAWLMVTAGLIGITDVRESGAASAAIITLYAVAFSAGAVQSRRCGELLILADLSLIFSAMYAFSAIQKTRSARRRSFLTAAVAVMTSVLFFASFACLPKEHPEPAAAGTGTVYAAPYGAGAEAASF